MQEIEKIKDILKKENSNINFYNEIEEGPANQLFNN